MYLISFYRARYVARKESEARAAQEDSDAGSIEEVNEQGSEEGDREYQEGSEEIAPEDGYGDAEVQFRKESHLASTHRLQASLGAVLFSNLPENATYLRPSHLSNLRPV